MLLVLLVITYYQLHLLATLRKIELDFGALRKLRLYYFLMF